MGQHIKKYDTSEDFNEGITELEYPYVAYVEDYESGNSTTFFSAEIDYVEEHGEEITEYVQHYKAMLEALREEVAKLKANGGGVYLYEEEYNKLVSGRTAHDMYGNLITTKWNDSGVTYYVIEDEEIITGDTNTHTTLDGDLLYMTNTDMDGNLLKVYGTKIENNLLVFTSSSSNSNTIEDNKLIMGEGNSSLDVTENGTFLLVSGTLTDNNTLEL